jgi:hypothetical protein
VTTGGKKARVSKEGTEDADEAKQRSPRVKFLEKEDEYLTRAWVRTTVDPLKGVQQKGSVFWSKVADCFQKLCSENGVKNGLYRRKCQHKS